MEFTAGEQELNDAQQHDPVGGIADELAGSLKVEEGLGSTDMEGIIEEELTAEQENFLLVVEEPEACAEKERRELEERRDPGLSRILQTHKRLVEEVLANRQLETPQAKPRDRRWLAQAMPLSKDKIVLIITL